MVQKSGPKKRDGRTRDANQKSEALHAKAPSGQKLKQAFFRWHFGTDEKRAGADCRSAIQRRDVSLVYFTGCERSLDIVGRRINSIYNYISVYSVVRLKQFQIIAQNDVSSHPQQLS